VREFKEPYYTGPECVCCKKPEVEITLESLGEQLVRKIQADERQKMVHLIETELLWPQLDDGYRGGLQWMLRQLTDPEANGV
jgi:hypothetical protein